MTEVVSKPVVLTKMCELHGIDMPKEGELAERFSRAFPSANYDQNAGEWRMVWKKGAYAESKARLEAFFTDNGVEIRQVDRC